jgi:LacI family transcriptional regulator
MATTARMSDVAKLAGVSTMTVSRVLNQQQNVTDELRRKVLAAVKQLRYQPNDLARSLRDRKSRQIGVIVPYLHDPFFAICAHSISGVAQRHGYSVVLSTSDEDPQREIEEANRMLRRSVEGLIVMPAQPKASGSLLLAAEFQTLPVVAVDRPIPGAHFDSLVVENASGARHGTEHLLALGHKRIACISLTPKLYTMGQRQRGYRDAMQAAGLRAQVTVVSGDPIDSLKALQALLARKDPPTALFCANNLVTRQVLHHLQTLQINPPQAIALVGFDDFETADLMRPGITVVRQPVEQLGRISAEMLFHRLTPRGQSRPPQETILPVELIVRGSCGAAGS